MNNKLSLDTLNRRIESLEKALRLSEKEAVRYRTMFDDATNAAAIINSQTGRIVDVNQTAVKMFGFTRDELIQKEFFSLGLSDPPFKWGEENTLRVLKVQKPLEFEWVAGKKNGDVLHTRLIFKKYVINDEPLVFAVVMDISDQYKREQLVKNIQRLAKIGAWEFDIETGEYFATEETFRMMGIEPDEQNLEAEEIFQRCLTCFTPDHRVVIQTAIEKCIEDGTPYVLEFPIDALGGKTVWIKTEATRIDRRIVGYLRDISLSKQQEAALHANEIRYKTIIQAASIGFLLMNRQGRFLDTNDAYCKMSGYTREELFSMTVMDLDLTLTKDSLAAKMEQAMNEKYDRFETKHWRKDGIAYDVQISVKYLKYSSTDEGQFVNFISDLSTLKKAAREKAELENKLNQLQKLESIGHLAGGIAHDLNNLLSPFLGYTEMLMEDTTLSPSHQAKLESIHKSGVGAKNLVRQLLAFSRKQTLNFRILDIDKIILDFKPLLQSTIREDIILNIISEPSGKTVKADQTQLEQILMNLSLNAADSMSDGGTLTIRTKETHLDEAYASIHPGVLPGKYVLISFADTGHGMDKETCARVFEPFYSTKGTMGTGLGLATVYGIVKQHNGNIWVYSEVGKGSVFNVYLPLIIGKEASEFKLNDVDVRDLKGHETILLAEDNEEVRNLISDVLTRNGYTVFPAENGNAALEIWAGIDLSIDLLVTDVIMPEMNGRELFDSLHSMDKSIKVLYVSGYPDNVIAHHGILNPDVQYIQKPFVTDDFLLKVRQVLDNQA